jgi:hypothetical protein
MDTPIINGIRMRQFCAHESRMKLVFPKLAGLKKTHLFVWIFICLYQKLKQKKDDASKIGSQNANPLNQARNKQI